MRGWFSPGSVIWVAIHILILAFGAFMMDSSGVTGTIGEEAADAIGSSLIATGAAGILLFIYVQKTDAIQKRLAVFSDAGLATVFRLRAAQIKPEYDSRLRDAREIDVIGWGLSNFREDYGGQFEEWSKRAKVRILIVDPDYPNRKSSIADIRDKEENRPVGDIKRHVDAFQVLLVEKGLAGSASFQVRLMRALPAINLLRADDEIFWGPYLMGNQSRNTPTLLVRRGGFLFTALKDHFDAVWERSA